MTRQEKIEECRDLFNEWLENLIELLDAWNTIEDKMDISEIDSVMKSRQASMSRQSLTFPFNKIKSILAQPDEL